MIIGGLDTETTGLLDPDHRIIELCIERYEWDGISQTLLDSETWRIDPKRSIDAKARAVHGIFESDLVGKPEFKSVAPIIVERLNTCKFVVAHNGLDFDFPFVIQELDRVDVAIPEFEPFDTMVNGRWATPFGKAPNLQELCWACGVDYDPAAAHAADYDVSRMMSCFFYGLRRGVYSLSTS